MQWLELILALEAALQAVLAFGSCIRLLGLARRAVSQGRRVGAAALALVLAGLASEAALFISQAPPVGSPSRSAALLAVRTALLVSAALVTVLVLRHSGRR